MRDPDRIPEILELINQIWQRDVDLRFNQLIYILQSEYSSANGGEGKVEEKIDFSFSRVGFDMFNTEDDGFISFLKSKLNE